MIDYQVISEKIKKDVPLSIEELGTIIYVLEKQIPQRVIEESIGLDCFLRFCPNCGVRFLRIGHGYCGECGQALKWSDNE